MLHDVKSVQGHLIHGRFQRWIIQTYWTIQCQERPATWLGCINTGVGHTQANGVRKNQCSYLARKYQQDKDNWL